MAGNNKCKSETLSRILLGVLIITVSVAPWVQADGPVPSGETWDIDYPVSGFLDVYGTVNFWPGSSVEYSITAYPGKEDGQSGAMVNIYDCEIGWWLDVYEPVAPDWLGQPPVVTIYGPKFSIDSTVYLPPADVPISGLLEVLSETNEILFSLMIYSDIDVYLRAMPKTGPEEIAIDIKPGSYPNSINLGSKGVVPVAVLSDGGFDAADVDPDTVDFAGASPVRWAFEDVDDDGDIDMILHFKTQELSELDENSTEAILTGQTNDTGEIQGSDTVKIVPSKKKK